MAHSRYLLGLPLEYTRGKLGELESSVGKPRRAVQLLVFKSLRLYKMEKRSIFHFTNSKTIINAEMMENVACCHVSVLKWFSS